MDAIWLSSYPKSGNTWVSAFLYHYFFGTPKSSKQILAQIPDIHALLSQGQILNEDTDHTTMCKTHFLYSAAHPHISKTKAFIYVMRHPKDVLLSGLNFHKICNPEHSITPDLEYQYARNFIENMGDPAWKKMGFGTWPEHILSWLEVANQHPSICIRYEELRRNPQTFRQILDFLYPSELNEARFQQALEATSLESMKALEKKEKLAGEAESIFPGGKSSLEKNLYFVNKGKMGQTLAHLGDDLDEMFEQYFGESLQALDY